MAWHGQEGQTGLIGLIDRITGPAEADTIVSHPTSYPSLEELFLSLFLSQLDQAGFSTTFSWTGSASLVCI